MKDSKLFLRKGRKIHKRKKKEKKEDKSKTILFIILILIIFFELFIILIQNNFIKNKLHEEEKFRNEKDIESEKKIEKKLEYKKYSDLLNLDLTSYAQYLEDIILFLFLHDIKTGFYIDVGANDPIIDSVTNFFYLRGWNGINIEPLNDKYILLKEKRPRDINLNIAAGKEKGSTTLYIYKGLTTTIKNYSRPWAPTKIVKVETMADICKEYVPKGIRIDFCKIDVEGGERNVLLGYDFINYRPIIFCIESTLPLSMIPSYQLFEDILIENNYSFIYQYNINRFYVDNKNVLANILRQRVTLINLYIEKYNDKINNKYNYIPSFWYYQLYCPFLNLI